jgi:hypothetical protein
MTKGGQFKTIIIGLVALAGMAKQGGRRAVRQHGGRLRGVEEAVRRGSERKGRRLRDRRPHGGALFRGNNRG